MIFQWLLAQNLLMQREHAASLLYDHVFKDWTDVIRRIDVPNSCNHGAKAALSRGVL